MANIIYNHSSMCTILHYGNCKRARAPIQVYRFDTLCIMHIEPHTVPELGACIARQKQRISPKVENPSVWEHVLGLEIPGRDCANLQCRWLP